MLSGMFIGYALNFGRGWIGDSIIADWYDIEKNVASGCHVTGFKPKVVGSKILQRVQICPCADGSLKQEGHAQRQTFRLKRVESFDARRVRSTLGEAR